MIPPPFDLTELALQQAPHASAVHGDFRVSWPLSGAPIALDSAGATLLDCFDGGATPRELANDMVDALGVTHHDALSSVLSFAEALIHAGHLEQVGQAPEPRFLSAYPPFASA